MNKMGFIKELSKETGYDEQKCIMINDIIESYFIFGRKNKDKIIQDLQRKSSLSEDDAENVYDISMKIITREIKDKLKHPFKRN
jgi:hypothetical protein